MTIGWGIVGCGAIADIHARAIQSLPGVKLVACYSRNADRTGAFAAQHACRASSVLGDMVGDPRIQIVSIATPSGAHLEPALAAIRSGKHVVVEKPLEVTVARCQRMVAAAEQHQVLLAPVFQSRFLGSVRATRSVLDQGRFGKLILVSVQLHWYRTQAYYDTASWRGTWNLDGGGALMNQGIHSVDLLRYLAGPVEQVTGQMATRAHERIEVEDVLTATLRFSSGALGVIEASTATFPGSPRRLEIHGTDGMAVLEDDQLTAWHFRRARKSDAETMRKWGRHSQATGGAADPKAIGAANHACQFRDILHAIRHHRPPDVDGYQAMAAVELVQAIYKAARTGKVIRLKTAHAP